MHLTLSFLATGVLFFAWGYGVGKTVTPPSQCPNVEAQTPELSGERSESARMQC